MESQHQYINCFKAAGAPESLAPFVIHEAVWPTETLERHSRALRKFMDSRKQYSTLDSLDRVSLDHQKLKRLQSLVNFAYKHIPFYKRFYSEAGFQLGDLKTIQDFERLPVLEKSHLRELYQERTQNPWVQVNHKSRTSGSTGVPVSLINDVERTDHWFVTRMHMFEDMIQAPLKEEDWIYSIYYEPFLLSSIFGSYRTFTVGLKAAPEDLAAHIRQIKPRIITGVASHVLKVAKLLPDAKDLGILAFSTNSESSSKDERLSILNFNGVPVLDEYSSEELGIIAWEQRNGEYVVAEDTVHVELVNKDASDMASVLGTDLWNYTMPRIRYAQGDFAEWASNQVPEQGLRRLKRILGRQDMALFSTQKGLIDPAPIQEIFDRTLVTENSGVEEFRLVQKSPHDVRLLLKLKNPSMQWSPAVTEFEKCFAKIFGETTSLKLEKVSALPTLGLKRRSIVREFHV